MTDPTTEPTAAPAGRCFLCGDPLRYDLGEPVEPAEGLELCTSCGAIYAHPGGCC